MSARYRECANCGVTYWQATEYQDRCSTCLDKWQDSASDRCPPYRGGRSRSSRYPKRIEHEGGTVAIIYSPTHARTIGRDYTGNGEGSVW